MTVQIHEGRRPYSTPKLTRFGLVAELTQSGSGPSESQQDSMSDMTCEPIFKPNPNCGT
ncbi:MAG: hypothetical protein U9R22_08105 [Pseudomonadota bacterium]|nr:hypothetical protein [Pseudomonadota bacterium]